KKVLSERYITLLYNDAKLNWTEKNAERLDEIRKITSGLSASGLRPAADSLLASSSYMQAMGEQDKWHGFKSASYIKLLELHGNDRLDYIASTERFTNPTGIYLNSESTINPSHPILDAFEKQFQYYTLTGKAQMNTSLPSIRLLAGYAYRGTGISPNGTVSGNWRDGYNNTTNNLLVEIGIIWNITSLHTNRLESKELFKEAESTRS